jgi:hypothetical protein
MNKMKFNTQASYDWTKQRYTKTTGKSMTVPDQSFTLRTILQKFTTGQPINNTGTYNNYDYQKGQEFKREDFAEFKKDLQSMDLTEQKASIIDAQNQLTDIKKTRSQKPKPIEKPTEGQPA